MEEPPAKKIRPYVTKRERRKAVEKTLDISYEEPNLNDATELFITDETVLEYQDRLFKASLPRKVTKTASVSKTPVWCIQWCKKFSHLIAATCGDSLKLFDVMKSKEIANVLSIKHTSPFRYCDWSRTSRQLTTCCFDGRVNVYDFLNFGKISDTLKVDTQPTTIRWWEGEDNKVLIGGSNSFLASYDLRSGKEIAKYKFKCGKILALEFFTDEKSFVASSDEVNRQSAEHNLIVWDLRMGAKVSNQIFHERYTCPCIRAHPSGANFLAQTTGNYIARFSTQKPYRLDKFVRYQNHTVNEFPVSFDITKDGSYVYSGSSSESLVCYKHSNGNYLRTVPLPPTNDGQDAACVDVRCHPVLPSMVAVSDWHGRLHVVQ
ncbi:WD repeat-containing protein 25 [Ciona intestinalis]